MAFCRGSMYAESNIRRRGRGMEKPQPKKNYRDSLFRRYFENPVDLAGLYKALTGEIVAPEDIKITTLKNVLFNNQKNDISFQVGNRYLILMEHQSTINPNMPIRMLFYVALLYRRMISRNLIYAKQQIKLPAPEFYVLYNGPEPLEDQVLRLSTAFEEEAGSSMELVVTLKNIRYNKDNEMLQQCRPLHDYSYFVYQVEMYCNQGHSLREAMQLAAADCLEQGIMEKFLTENYEEVFDMSLLRWNEKDAKKYWQEEAREDGWNDAMVSNLKSLMANMHWTAEAAMAALGVPKSDYDKYLAALE